MTSRRRFTRWRRIALAAQGLLWLGLPFLEIGGESALRLDVPAGRLHAFGASFAIDEAFVVLAATLLATAAFLLLTLLWGRVFCGWSCPQTLLGDLTALVVPERRKKKRPWRRPVGFALVALVSAVVSADLVWYFVSPHEFFGRLAAGTLGPVIGGSWAALGAVLFLDLAFLRARFCATACPYAKLQGVLFDRHTLVVAYDARRAEDCVDCGACVRVCPTGIDIRDGLQMECIACAACIDACTPVMAKLRRAPNLVGYFHGEPGGRRRLLRPGTLALGAAAAGALAMLVAVLLGRSVLDMNAVTEDAFRPRRAADGRVVNAYSVALENHGREGLTVALALTARGAEVVLRPDAVALGPGERRQVRLVASARGLDEPGRFPAELTGEARAGDGAVARQSQVVPLVVPGAP
ncbi:MAG TPA: 4Fe-4S dicluster domain-containing protein [Anaeromyxobacteraceae bacterium]|nr:4Fe-4S dicluster domain-containing protein [Anaeromyxobacteraceae bacterium]